MSRLYETKISNARWIAYDLPGNIGWIAYIVALICQISICYINCYTSNAANLVKVNLTLHSVHFDILDTYIIPQQVYHLNDNAI